MSFPFGDGNHNMDDGSNAFRRGEQASLSVMRAAAASAPISSQCCITNALTTALEQFTESDENNLLLLEPLSVSASLKTERDGGADDDDDDDENEASSRSLIHDNFTDRIGTLVITSNSLLFWCEDNRHVTDDFVVDAVAIELHAVSEDDTVYLQISSSSQTGQRNQQPPMEVTFSPIMQVQDRQRYENCQAIFAALSRLVALHPVNPNDEEEDGPAFGTGNGADDDDDDEMVCAWEIPQAVSSAAREATLEERDEMLERLDNLLIIPPEFEQHTDDTDTDGQFDDAEEEEDDPLL